MKRTIGVFAAIFFSLFLTSAFAQEYDHTVEEKNMSFSWKIIDKNIHIKLSGKSTGWIGIGFNPTKQMKDANYILGYVKKGEASVTDDFGDSERAHKSDEKLGGTSDVTLIGGEEKGGVTTIEFSIPLDSGDKYDSALDVNGETTVLLAYGGSRDSFKSKHKFRATLKVNLSNGKVL